MKVRHSEPQAMQGLAFSGLTLVTRNTILVARKNQTKQKQICDVK